MLRHGEELSFGTELGVHRCFADTGGLGNGVRVAGSETVLDEEVADGPYVGVGGREARRSPCAT